MPETGFSDGLNPKNYQNGIKKRPIQSISRKKLPEQGSKAG